MSMRGDPWVPFHKKHRGSTEPRCVTIDLGNYERRSCYFFFLAAFLAAGFFAAFFFAAIIFLPPSLSDTDPRFHGLAGMIPL